MFLFRHSRVEPLWESFLRANGATPWDPSPLAIQDSLGIVLARSFFRFTVPASFLRLLGSSWGGFGLLLGWCWEILSSLGLFWGTLGSILEPSTSLLSPLSSSCSLVIQCGLIHKACVQCLFSVKNLLSWHRGLMKQRKRVIENAVVAS